MPRQPEDLTLTNPYGSLTALYIVEGEKRCEKPVWMCRCVCGNEHKAMAACLKRGNVKSCGKCDAVPRGGAVNAKKELRVSPDVLAYEEKPFKKRRPMTVEEFAIREARFCGAGRWNNI